MFKKSREELKFIKQIYVRGLDETRLGWIEVEKSKTDASHGSKVVVHRQKNILHVYCSNNNVFSYKTKKYEGGLNTNLSVWIKKKQKATDILLQVHIL